MIVTQHLSVASKENIFGITEHTTTIDVNPSQAWPDSMRVALLWLSATAKKRRIFTGKGDAEIFQENLNGMAAMPGGLTAILDRFNLQLDKDGDKWRILRTITASPKPIGMEPPNSICPRCGQQVWQGDKKADRTTEFKRNPYPLYCLNCGQRYKYDDGALAYTSDINTEQWTERLTVEEIARQPELGATA